MHDLNVTQNERSIDRGFSCGMTPMSESADSLIDKCEHDGVCI